MCGIYYIKPSSLVSAMSMRPAECSIEWVQEILWSHGRPLAGILLRAQR